MKLSLGLSTPGLAPETADELEQSYAAIQTSVNSIEGYGVWNDPPIDDSYLSVGLGGAAGDTWKFSQLSPRPDRRLSYYLVGPTMVISVELQGTALVLAAPVTIIQARIPGGFVAARDLSGCVSIVDSGSSGRGSVTTTATQSVIYFNKDNGTFINGTGLTIRGQIAIEVTRP